ncbi:MAG: hypothetical protein AAF772_08605 [Acidobacteriota bacterium]
MSSAAPLRRARALPIVLLVSGVVGQAWLTDVRPVFALAAAGGVVLAWWAHARFDGDQAPHRQALAAGLVALTLGGLGMALGAQLDRTHHAATSPAAAHGAADHQHVDAAAAYRAHDPATHADGAHAHGGPWAWILMLLGCFGGCALLCRSTIGHRTPIGPWLCHGGGTVGMVAAMLLIDALAADRTALMRHDAMVVAMAIGAVLGTLIAAGLLRLAPAADELESARPLRAI